MPISADAGRRDRGCPHAADRGALTGEQSLKPVETARFRRFLKNLGLVHKRTRGSHEIWDYPDASRLDRPVVFRGDEREIPPSHISTNLKTLGMSPGEFEKRIRTL